MNPQDVLWEQGRDLVCPFDHSNASALKVFLQPQVLCRSLRSEAEEVDMSDRKLSRVFMDECKGRARNVGESNDPSPGGQSFDQVSLPCSQFTDKGDHVSWSQEATDFFP